MQIDSRRTSEQIVVALDVAWDVSRRQIEERPYVKEDVDEMHRVYEARQHELGFAGAARQAEIEFVRACLTAEFDTGYKAGGGA